MTNGKIVSALSAVFLTVGGLVTAVFAPLRAMSRERGIELETFGQVVWMMV